MLSPNPWKSLVGTTGFEPATSASRTQRSTRLSHVPTTMQMSFLPKASGVVQQKKGWGKAHLPAGSLQQAASRIVDCEFRNSRLESYFALYAYSYWLLATGYWLLAAIFCEFALSLLPKKRKVGASVPAKNFSWQTSSKL